MTRRDQRPSWMSLTCVCSNKGWQRRADSLSFQVFLSFFLSWVTKSQFNHSTQRVVRIRLITYTQRTIPNLCRPSLSPFYKLALWFVANEGSRISRWLASVFIGLFPEISLILVNGQDLGRALFWCHEKWWFHSKPISFTFGLIVFITTHHTLGWSC